MVSISRSAQCPPGWIANMKNAPTVAGRSAFKCCRRLSKSRSIWIHDRSHLVDDASRILAQYLTEKVHAVGHVGRLIHPRHSRHGSRHFSPDQHGPSRRYRHDVVAVGHHIYHRVPWENDTRDILERRYSRWGGAWDPARRRYLRGSYLTYLTYLTYLPLSWLGPGDRCYVRCGCPRNVRRRLPSVRDCREARRFRWVGGGAPLGADRVHRGSGLIDCCTHLIEDEAGVAVGF